MVTFEVGECGYCAQFSGEQPADEATLPPHPTRHVRAWHLRKRCQVPYFLVDIRGDALRAMGLLAKVGIQNIPSDLEPTELLTARISADTPQNAHGRVLAALDGETFAIDAVRPEDADWLQL
jgi:hypothetical protein